MATSPKPTTTAVDARELSAGRALRILGRWGLLTDGGVAFTLVAAIGCYPLSKVLWLAFDVILRPVTREELDLGREDTRVVAPRRDP